MGGACLSGEKSTGKSKKEKGKSKKRKYQAPSFRSQKITISNHPMTKTKKRDWQCLCFEHWKLKLGACLEFGACDLEF